MFKKIFTILPFTFLYYTTSNAQSNLNRPFDPVVLTGLQLSSLKGKVPLDIVAFKYISGNWIQIPIQVDEKVILDITAPYGPHAIGLFGTSTTGVNEVFFADAGTYVGNDTDPSFDDNDELAFMAKDAGENTTTADPSGVNTGTKVRVTITDPIDGKVGYVYLFEKSLGSSLTQDAGLNYVTYNFKLSNGGIYPRDFNFDNARNNEDSRVNTNNYSLHLAAEWISDEVKITTGGASNIDILDRHKNFYKNGICLRSEDTFSDGVNAFATNKSGPVRAIRSIMGANSGPLTQRTHIFYQTRQDIITNLRVHSIASIYDAFDYNSNANGMKYSNNLNTTGVTINGSRDAVSTGDISWELAGGSKGSIVILHRHSTTFTSSEATFTSYYDDNKSKPASNCTGDGQAWGTSGIGMVFKKTSLCTDPLSTDCGITTSNYRTLESRRTTYFEAPNAVNNTAISYNDKLNNPLSITIGDGSASSLRIISQTNQSIKASTQDDLMNKIRVSPNPTTGKFTILFYSDKNYNGDITILDIFGKVVIRKNILISSGFNSNKINIQNLLPGLYYVRLSDGKKQSVMKLVVN
jgi:hypothetical protein